MARESCFLTSQRRLPRWVLSSALIDRTRNSWILFDSLAILIAMSGYIMGVVDEAQGRSDCEEN